MFLLSCPVLTSTIDALHKNRLLPIEQRPFLRLTKMVLAENSPARFDYSGGVLATPPPESAKTTSANTPATARSLVPTTESALEKTSSINQRRQWHSDMKAELEGFRSSIVRIQLLLNSNDRDRRRYAEEREKIVEKTRAVRENMVALQSQLDQARETKALRLQYDGLADEITSSRSLLPRSEQQLRLAGLRNDIGGLEREKEQYGDTWAERRSQFMRIVDEGKTMLALIRDEKREADRKEGMMTSRSSVPPEGPAAADPMVTDDPDDPLPATKESGGGPVSVGDVPTIAVSDAAETTATVTTTTTPAKSKRGRDSPSDGPDDVKRSRSKDESSNQSAGGSSPSGRSGDHLNVAQATPVRSPSPLSQVVSSSSSSSPPPSPSPSSPRHDRSPGVSDELSDGQLDPDQEVDSDEDGEIVEDGAGSDRMEEY